MNIPANAPHMFKNLSGAPARMLCLCVPAGLDAFFLEVGDPLESRTSPPPHLDSVQMKARIAKIVSLAPKYRTELLTPGLLTKGAPSHVADPFFRGHLIALLVDLYGVGCGIHC